MTVETDERFRGEITKAQEAAAIRAFLADVDAGRFERIECDPGGCEETGIIHGAVTAESQCHHSAYLPHAQPSGIPAGMRDIFESYSRGLQPPGSFLPPR